MAQASNSQAYSLLRRATDFVKRHIYLLKYYYQIIVRRRYLLAKRIAGQGIKSLVKSRLLGKPKRLVLFEIAASSMIPVTLSLFSEGNVMRWAAFIPLETLILLTIFSLLTSILICFFFVEPLLGERRKVLAIVLGTLHFLLVCLVTFLVACLIHKYVPLNHLVPAELAESEGVSREEIILKHVLFCSFLSVLATGFLVPVSVRDSNKDQPS